MKQSAAVVFALALAAGEVAAIAQESNWERHLRAGNALVLQGQFADAERSFVSAVREAEKFGPNDQRVAVALASLALFYMNQGQSDKALPFATRALAIRAGKEVQPDRFQFSEESEAAGTTSTHIAMGTFVNGVALTPETVERLAAYGIQVQPGRYSRLR